MKKEILSSSAASERMREEFTTATAIESTFAPVALRLKDNINNVIHGWLEELKSEKGRSFYGFIDFQTGEIKKILKHKVRSKTILGNKFVDANGTYIYDNAKSEYKLVS